MFRRFSIRVKLILHGAVTAVVVLILATVGQTQQQLASLESYLSRQLEASVAIVSEGLVAPLAFADSAAAATVLWPLYNSDDVLTVAFYLDSGELFLALPDGSQSQPPEWIFDGGAGTRKIGERLVTYRTLRSSGRTLGVLYLEADPASLDEQAFQILKVTSLSLLGGLLLAVVVATLLVRRMTSGLLNLTQTAREVSNTRNYSLRATALDKDEIGTLVQAFNEMLQVVQERTNELQVAQAQLQLAQRLEAVGQLAAGVAHEINTPIQYLTDNTNFLARCFEGLSQVIAQLRGLLGAVQDGSVDDALLQEVEEALRTSKIDYLIEEAPSAISQSLEGLSRVSAIIRSMGEFAHPSDRSKAPVDLNQLVESIVTLSRSQWRYVATLKTDLDSELPLVTCNRDTIGQTLVNLVINAAHAIEGSRDEEGGLGEISLQTRLAGDQVEIRVTDNGSGIPEALQSRIFDPFFTTKEVGLGTGQGLALAWSYVVNEHRGAIRVDSAPGRGASFLLRLPISPQAGASEE